jgi:hypothetical protein
VLSQQLNIAGTTPYGGGVVAEGRVTGGRVTGGETLQKRKNCGKSVEPEGTAKIDAISKHRASILTSAFFWLAGLFALGQNCTLKSLTVKSRGVVSMTQGHKIFRKKFGSRPVLTT